MLRSKSTLVIFAVCAALPACAQVQQKEDLLASAGFTLVPANTPRKRPSSA